MRKPGSNLSRIAEITKLARGILSISRSSLKHRSGIHTGGCNSDSIAQKEIARLVQKYQVMTIVETGTYKGKTTWYLSSLSTRPLVHSIEIDPHRYDTCLRKFKKSKNIKLYLGSSVLVLETLIPELPEDNALFYLDAHGNDYWPLLDELGLITTYRGHRDIIVIDDFKVPGKDYQYDTYLNQPNDLAYISTALPLDKYDYFFPGRTNLVVDSQERRGIGKIYLIPKGNDTNNLFDVENEIPYSNI